MTRTAPPDMSHELEVHRRGRSQQADIRNAAPSGPLLCLQNARSFDIVPGSCSCEGLLVEHLESCHAWRARRDHAERRVRPFRIPVLGRKGPSTTKATFGRRYARPGVCRFDLAIALRQWRVP